ncbi:MAG: hypothetical protein ISS95_00705 [Candidatus Aenigmarchaeota archaeon]|nr:hypothetical protein [Candidatus Aenigmarchaeota archaeon]
MTGKRGKGFERKKEAIEYLEPFFRTQGGSISIGPNRFNPNYNAAYVLDEIKKETGEGKEFYDAIIEKLDQK